MSGNIDERVVAMKFDNAEFQNRIGSTISALDALNQKLKLENAGKGFAEVSAAAQHVQLGHIASAVDDIGSHFKAMSIVAITALANIATRAFSYGESIVKSLTVDPINAGLQEYQTNINSIQTILSNTRWQNTGLDDVNKALDELNHYSDQTIYNFSQMARNIGTFTAAGVKLDVSVGAIKGIANLAAVSGSNAEQASMAMYQLSQALATGTVKLIDWNSVVNAGMGGKVFQDALMETARVHGVAIDEMLKDAGSFRATLEKGWLSADILTETLQQFTGDLTKEQVLSMGYTEEQADAIIAMGKDAQDAATKVKTISQLLNTLQETAGSGWSRTWQTIFGNFEEARTLFTSVNDVLSGMIQKNADARNEMLDDWKELGGRTALIDAIRYAFNDLMEILHPIALAWREAFPRTTGEQLYKITVAIRDFFDEARLGEDTMTNIKRTFAGLFAVLGIGWDIIKQVGRVIFDLFGMFGDGAGSILGTTATIGDFLVALRKAINEGDGLVKFFDGLEKVLALPIKLLNNLAKILSHLFQDIDTDKAAEGVTNFVKQLGPLGTLADFIVYAWERIGHVFGEIWDFFSPLADKFMVYFQRIQSVVGKIDFNDVFNGIQTGAFVALVAVIQNGLGKGGITGALSQLTSTLTSMQHTLQAATLLEIAAAVGILAIACTVLASIDSGKLTTALSAIAIMFTQLLAALAVMSKMPETNVLKLYVTAAALTVMAIAIDLLVIAVKTLSSLDWMGLLKGLTGVTVLLAALVGAVRLMPSGAQLISAGAGLLLVAVAVDVLVVAVKQLSDMNPAELAKGLTGVAALLGALALFTKFAKVDATGVLAGAGIVLLAYGIKILADAVISLQNVSWENVGKGMAVLAASLLFMQVALDAIPPTAPLAAAGVVGIAAAMLIISDAMHAMSDVKWENVGKGMAVMATSLVLISAALLLIPPTAPLSAAGVLIVAIALGYLADSMKKISSMSWANVAEALVVMAVALALISVSLILMEEALPGALALLVASGALVVLAGVIKTLGEMKISEVIQGLIVLAAALAILGVAAALLQPVLPAMIGLGLALSLIGLGLALAGAGVFLFAAGLTALSVAGAAGASAIVAIVTAVLSLVPTIVKTVGIALLMLIDILIEATPKIVDLLVGILLQLLDALVEIMPKVWAVLGMLIDGLLKLLVDAIPKMTTAGIKILIGILKGIRDNIGDVVDVAGDIIINFLEALGKKIPEINQAGVDLILDFIRGMTKTIDDNSEELGKAGGDLAVAIIKGMVKGINAGMGEVGQAARDLASHALSSIGSFLGIHSPSTEFAEIGEYSAKGMAVGVDDNADLVIGAIEKMGNGALNAMKATLARVADEVPNNLEMTPTIRPVLDLTGVQKDAGLISKMLAAQPMRIDTAYSAAKDVSAAYDANKEMAGQGGDGSNTTNLNYTQNNYSPKTISAKEVYRNTKNQLSTAKGGLPT